MAEGQRQWQRQIANDPFTQKMNIAFTFTAMCWTLWWNLQWKRVMRFWLKPPYHPWVEVLFRIFFAANLIGATSGLVHELISHPLAKQDLLPTIWIAAIMCAVVGGSSAFVLRIGERRDAKAALRMRFAGDYWAGARDRQLIRSLAIPNPSAPRTSHLIRNVAVEPISLEQTQSRKSSSRRVDLLECR